VGALQFKFKEQAGREERDRLIATLREHGAENVRALFPGENDPELAALYLADGGDAEALRRLLEGSSAVEFAEPEVRRKPL
jgi:hypothetical protein